MNLFFETNTRILAILAVCEMVNALKSRVFKTQFCLTLLQIDHLAHECEALAIICQPPSINVIDGLWLTCASFSLLLWALTVFLVF